MRESKRYTSLLLALALAACGGEGGAPAADEAQEPAAETAPADTEAAVSMDLPEGVTAAMVTEGEAIFTGAGICFTGALTMDFPHDRTRRERFFPAIACAANPPALLVAETYCARRGPSSGRRGNLALARRRHGIAPAQHAH